MKNKYKLIKTYPGSPELGTIAEKAGDIKYTYPDGRESLSSSAAECLFEKLIVNQPEYWQKIVEKDYEILSVKSIPLGLIWKCFKDSTFGISYKGDVFYCNGGAIRGFEILEGLNKGRYSIYSVKRLSDGEVFTIGDIITGNYESGVTEKKKIDEFIIYNNSILVKHHYLEYSTSQYLDKISKIKPPLFTTEDGVDIYEGNYVCWIETIKPGNTKINDYRTADKLMVTDGSILYFSTKKAAKEYIKLNSIKDYEILSIKCKVKNFGGYILNKIHNGKFANEYKQIDFTSEFYDIHSVKRLSDGEIFTVDDKVRLIFNNTSIVKIIDKIALEKIGCQPEMLYIYTEGEQSTINNYVKVKQPLFTTEDGADIYEGDKYYNVSTLGFYNKSYTWDIITNKAKGFINYDQEVNRKRGNIWFSTKEKAEEYVFRNKPCLSLNDVVEIYKTAGMSMKEYNDKISRNVIQDYGVKIIKKVKEKLNME